MNRYAFLILPSHNRVYADAAPSLARAELAVLSGALPDGRIEAESVAETAIGGVPYVTFAAGELSQRDVGLLANLSSLYALFELPPPAPRAGRGTAATRAAAPPRPLRRRLADHTQVPRKTNEQFTKLLLNVTLASSAFAGIWTRGGFPSSTRCAAAAPRSTRR